MAVGSDEENQEWQSSFNMIDSTSWHHSEKMPRRSNTTIEKKGNRIVDYKEEWGVEHGHRDGHHCPSTLGEVVNGAFEAIGGTLYQKQKPDPNVASNAMSKSVLTHRPVRREIDVGRIGVEIDGAEHLFREPISSIAATRLVSLVLAGKLSSNDSWEPYEGKINAKSHKESTRPVVVCFNTIRQALSASKELSRLRFDPSLSLGFQGERLSYDNVKVQCLDDGLPRGLLADRTKRKRYNGLSEGHVNARKAILLIVQPTDFNSEHKPPGPAVDAIGNFQRLVAKAALEEVPVVILSPRFLSNDTPYGGWDQSGYQQSATYGGMEPPKGPTPWVMRDFTPPSYCWVGNALPLHKIRTHPASDGRSQRKQSIRVVLTQSVMESGHPWNIFVAKESSDDRHGHSVEYLFIATTRSSSGRPTRALLMRLLEESM
eukprot:CAMPEP_0176005522 /NCGR_PEP_ID=MMETSP0120_2-20121206/2251_1 /TAXON_ID=160619 /ORGANISM="Kryptoperidinium foliaceum, Strain CCMP 1326" /LENGTH=429 /DNA_ID=CAMNT_0017338235 /DNA_START=398 /DNA_END=1687 /DNA_ORIENTATION=+